MALNKELTRIAVSKNDIQTDKNSATNQIFQTESKQIAVNDSEVLTIYGKVNQPIRPANFPETAQRYVNAKAGRAGMIINPLPENIAERLEALVEDIENQTLTMKTAGHLLSISNKEKEIVLAMALADNIGRLEFMVDVNKLQHLLLIMHDYQAEAKDQRVEIVMNVKAKTIYLQSYNFEYVIDNIIVN